jgi:hypothetical protein
MTEVPLFIVIFGKNLFTAETQRTPRNPISKLRRVLCVSAMKI